MTASLRPHDLCDHVIISQVSKLAPYLPTHFYLLFSNDYHPQSIQGDRAPRGQMVMSSLQASHHLAPSEQGLHVKSHLKTLTMIQKPLPTALPNPFLFFIWGRGRCIWWVIPKLPVFAFFFFQKENLKNSLLAINSLHSTYIAFTTI